MDLIDRLTGRGMCSISMKSLFKLSNLHPHVQTHLVHVYVTLAAALVVCAAGVAADAALQLAGWLATAGLFGCSMALALTPSERSTLTKRYALLAGAAFCQGVVLGPLVVAVASQYAGMVVTALLGTSAVFACFSAAAVITPRRSYLYLGGYLSSALLAMPAMRLAAAVSGGGSALFTAELYLGLLVFMGYVVVDTQVIVERAHAGDMDHVKHALELFIDFVAMFVRLLIILARNAQKAEKRDESRRGRATCGV